MLALMESAGTDVAVIQECPARPGELPPGWYFDEDVRQCIVSRHPVEQLDRLDMAGLTPGGQQFGGTSAASRYRISLPETPITVVNVHLETARRGLRGLFTGDLDRMANNLGLRQVESSRIFAWLGSDIDDVIVAGDFNMPVESAIYRAHWAKLGNAFSRAGRGFGMTRDNGWIRIRIDHILAGPSWRATRAWAGPPIGSDHRPVFAEFVRTSFPRPAPAPSPN
jgi:endonuclease/exonuclease/phosphatase family metal-dependent hydrolase